MVYLGIEENQLTLQYMKPNELRIGNYVSRPDIGNGQPRIETILSICSKVTVSGPIPIICDYIDIEPIPLTEEWLLKFGFRQSEHYFSNHGIRLYHSSEEYLFDVTNVDNGLIATSSYHIKYVHQLQNLYFAITGEELTVKETV